MRGRASRFVAVAGRRPQRGSVLGGGRGVAYVGFPTGVIALCVRQVPRMPNGVVLDNDQLPPLRPGAGVTLFSGVLRAGDVTVEWGDRTPFDLAVTSLRTTWPAISGFPEVDDPLFAGLVDHLARSLASRDVEGVASAAGALVGRGRGLTPEGDDLVAGAAAAGLAFGIPSRTIAAAVPPDLDVKTTALSATLLRLAVEGRVIEPFWRLLSDQASDLERAAWDLSNVGSSTGRCYLSATLAVVEACANRGFSLPVHEERK